MRGFTVTVTVVAAVPPCPSLACTTRLSVPFQLAVGAYVTTPVLLPTAAVPWEGLDRMLHPMVSPSASVA